MCVLIRQADLHSLLVSDCLFCCFLRDSRSTELCLEESARKKDGDEGGQTLLVIP